MYTKFQHNRSEQSDHSARYCLIPVIFSPLTATAFPAFYGQPHAHSGTWSRQKTKTATYWLDKIKKKIYSIITKRKQLSTSSPFAKLHIYRKETSNIRIVAWHLSSVYNFVTVKLHVYSYSITQVIPLGQPRGITWVILCLLLMLWRA